LPTPFLAAVIIFVPGDLWYLALIPVEMGRGIGAPYLKEFGDEQVGKYPCGLVRFVHSSEGFYFLNCLFPFLD